MEHGCDLSSDGLSYHAAGIVDYDHGTVIQIRDSLIVFFPFFQDENLHRLSGENDGFERVGQLVDVEDFDATELRDFVEIEIVGDNLGGHLLGELDEFEIHLFHIGVILLDNLHRDPGDRLYLLQDIESAAAAVTLGRIRAVGDLLQLAQHKVGNHQGPFQKSRLADVRHTPVDDNACVEHLAGLPDTVVGEKSSKRRQVEILSLIGS